MCVNVRVSVSVNVCPLVSDLGVNYIRAYIQLHTNYTFHFNSISTIPIAITKYQFQLSFHIDIKITVKRAATDVLNAMK